MLHVHPAGGREDLTTRSASRKAKRRHRPPGRTGHDEEHQRDQRTEQEEGDRGIAQQLDERRRASGDGAAEEVGRARPEHASGRHRVAAVSPLLGPGDRLGPLALQIGPCRTVEEGRLKLSPATLEGEPRERRARPRQRRSGSSSRPGGARDGDRACRRSRRPPPPSCRCRAPPCTCSHESRRPGRRRGECRRRARACPRPSPPARRPRASCSPPRPAPRRARRPHRPRRS